MRKKYVAFYGMLVALALVLSWVESQLPVLVAFAPGMKIGLTNLVVIVALYQFGAKDAFVINLVRIMLVGITFGNLFSMIYSLAGGLLSFLVMYGLKRIRIFGMTAVSLAGGLAHNIGQMIVAMIVLETKVVLYYLPFLWIGGSLAGVVVGLLGAQIVKRIATLLP